MKKDFIHDFDTDSVHAELIVRDSVSKKYLIYTSTEKHEEDFCRILRFDFDTGKQLSIQLAKFLYENNLVLNSFRKLAEETRVVFSFADDTPGVESTSLCFIAEVDVIEYGKLDQDHAKASFVSLRELLAKLEASPYFGIATDLGIALLISEDEILRS